MYDKIHKTQEKQLKYKLNKFAESQIQFLENERQMIEEASKDLATKPLDVLTNYLTNLLGNLENSQSNQTCSVYWLW